MACRTLSSTAFACSVCSGELSGFKVQYHPGACLSPWIICGRFNIVWTSPGETMWCCGRHAVWVSSVSYELGSSRWILHFSLVSIWLLLTCKLIPWWILPVLKFISSALRLIRFAWAVIYMWSMVRAQCVPSNFLALRGSSEGPLFTFSDGRPLSQQQLWSTVQSILHSAGYTGSYSGHSFRIGAATTAAARGVPDHLIKTLGWWSSDAYQIYIHTPDSSIVHVSRQRAA